jgi:hypothetical protein
MAKKEIKKAPAVEKTKVTQIGKDLELHCIESYALVKKRILDVNKFVEITVKTDGKKLINKSTLDTICPL